ncbi:MAG: N-formylglutamate amidohydrolase [Caldilineales bacterium]|nr:N-formylglutamate amidohydrolase [Caldilineales bacterium]
MSAPLPIAILVPHSGLHVPPELKSTYRLTEDAIFNEADIYTELLYDFRGRVTHWLRFPLARAAIDVNRPNDPRRTRPGDGVVKTQTSYGVACYQPEAFPNPIDEQALVERYWRKWHQQLASIAADRSVRLVLDCHSMAAIGPDLYDDPGALRPHACVANLGDADGEADEQRGRISASPALTRRFAGLLGEALADAPTLAPSEPVCRLNSPFWGGWDIWAHANRRQPWMMVEISRALYVGPQLPHSLVQPPNLARIEDLRERIWQAIVGFYETLESGQTSSHRIPLSEALPVPA